MNRITVIITVYNRRHFLQKALLALDSQSQPVDELIISDDGSDEDMLTLLREYASSVNIKVKYVRQENDGFRLAKCRNNAIRAAEGDFLIFIDQDVVYTRDYLKTFVQNSCNEQFVVAYPVRLSEEQTVRLTDEMIIKAEYDKLVNKKQIKKIHKQYYKDGFEYHWRKLFSRKGRKPKLRGGVCGIFKKDLLKVDGYDEHYQGWGNEDDDLGRRLYRAGITGFNPFFEQYPIHLYHEPFHVNGQRVNQEYYSKRRVEIANGDFRAKGGLSNPVGDEKIQIVELG